MVAVFIASEEALSEKGVGIDGLMAAGRLDALKNGTVLWLDSADSQPYVSMPTHIADSQSYVSMPTYTLVGWLVVPGFASGQRGKGRKGRWGEREGGGDEAGEVVRGEGMGMLVQC